MQLTIELLLNTLILNLILLEKMHELIHYHHCIVPLTISLMLTGRKTQSPTIEIQESSSTSLRASSSPALSRSSMEKITSNASGKGLGSVVNSQNKIAKQGVTGSFGNSASLKLKQEGRLSLNKNKQGLPVASNQSLHSISSLHKHGNSGQPSSTKHQSSFNNISGGLHIGRIIGSAQQLSRSLDKPSILSQTAADAALLTLQKKVQSNFEYSVAANQNDQSLTRKKLSTSSSRDVRAVITGTQPMVTGHQQGQLSSQCE